MKNNAFTLAEVLITLGIIGVIAALTIPTLIQNHRKSVIATKLEKFYSIMSQAILLSENENGSGETWETPGVAYDDNKQIDWEASANNSINVFNKYYKPYLNIAKIDEHPENVQKNAIKVILNDGAIFLFNAGDCPTFQFYPNGLKDTVIKGKDQFAFIHCTTDKFQKYYGVNKNFSTFCHPANKCTPRATLLETCKTSGEFCSRLIMQDGWKIEKDYPHKL